MSDDNHRTVHHRTGLHFHIVGTVDYIIDGAGIVIDDGSHQYVDLNDPCYVDDCCYTNIVYLGADDHHQLADEPSDEAGDSEPELAENG